MFSPKWLKNGDGWLDDPWVPNLTSISRISSKQKMWTMAVVVKPLFNEDERSNHWYAFVKRRFYDLNHSSSNGTGNWSLCPTHVQWIKWNHPIHGQASCDPLPWKQRRATWQRWFPSSQSPFVSLFRFYIRFSGECILGEMNMICM